MPRRISACHWPARPGAGAIASISRLAGSPPERTTEEFLSELQHNAVLGLQEQLLLRAFLRHCDLVKFAKAEPTSEEIRETFQTCQKFIIDSEAAHRAAMKAVAQAAAPAEA